MGNNNFMKKKGCVASLVDEYQTQLSKYLPQSKRQYG